MIYDGDIIKKAGRMFRVNIEADDDADPPWERSDGHGVVSDWVARKKHPSEVVLCGNWHNEHRFYDIKASTEIAHRDGWGLGIEEHLKLRKHLGHAPTKKEIARRAVQKDFDFLYGWANDQWWYVGVIVTDVTDGDVKPDYGHALWGIESNAGGHLEEVAHELIDQVLADLASTNETKCIQAENHRDEHPDLYAEMAQLIERYGADQIESALNNLGWLP